MAGWTKWRSILDTIATILIIAVSAAMLWRTLAPSASPRPAEAREPILPRSPVSLDGAQTMGAATAKVALIEFSDFECPFCGKFALNVQPSLKSRYVDTGKVVLAFRHLPLPFHRSAFKAGEAAECAARQGRFWEFSDRLFRDPSRLAEPDLRGHADALGLKSAEFDKCLSGESKARIQQDLADAEKWALASTPAFFVGKVRADGKVDVRKIILGLKSPGEMEAALDELLASDSSNQR